MTLPTQADQPDPDLLRRLREFQALVRRPPRKAKQLTPGLLALSQHQVDILTRLRRHSPSLANSMMQALRDVNDQARLTYMGPAGEVREVMRAAVQLFAPDDKIREQPWFQGHQQGGNRNPTQSERIRYAVQQRGGNKDQVIKADERIEQLLGEIGRETYRVGSKALHAGVVQSEVRRLVSWVFVVLDEVLPD